MKPSGGKKVPALASLLMALGTGWLMNVFKIVPGVNCAWVLGLAATGCLVPWVFGIDKVTVVGGPFLVIASACSLLRQLEWLRADAEAPLLVIASGALLLLARYPGLPAPAWLLDGERTVS